MNLLIVDDHALFREGLSSFLSDQAEVDRVDTVGTLSEAKDLVRLGAFDVVVLDVAMGNDSGIQAIAGLRRAAPSTRILMLSMHTSGAIVKAAMDAGASGFVTKDVAGQELMRALRIVIAGGTFIDPSVAPALARRIAVPGSAPMSERYARLSPREQEVFQLLAAGLKGGEIGEKLGVARKTADTHRYNVFRKMNLRNTTELVRTALDLGVID